ncbi:MAG: hypothetical protein JRI89_12275 [Deltaproteobacteria bacterium]|nr:hypothetical protein [Deltaproteobacteria bacterium]
MSKKATPIMLTEEQERTLKQWVRLPKTEQRLVLRSLIILAAAQGTMNNVDRDLELSLVRTMALPFLLR